MGGVVVGSAELGGPIQAICLSAGMQRGRSRGQRAWEQAHPERRMVRVAEAGKCVCYPAQSQNFSQPEWNVRWR